VTMLLKKRRKGELSNIVVMLLKKKRKEIGGRIYKRISILSEADAILSVHFG